MNKLHKIGLFLIMLALSFSCSEETLDESGFGTVKGRVVQAITFEPIANAKVSSNPNSSSVFTDVDG